MRLASKPNAKPGIYAGEQYRRGLKSVASDVEAMCDAYGANALHVLIDKIAEQIRIAGECRHNGIFNAEMNMLPVPVVRVIKKRGKRHV